MLIWRSIVPELSVPIGVERPGSYVAPPRVAPQAEKWLPGWGGGWLPSGNVVCVSAGTGSVLGAFPQACGPAVSPMPPHGTTCCGGGPGQFSLALYVPR